MHPDHAESLFHNIAAEQNRSLYNYMFYGPFTDVESFRMHVASFAASKDTQFYTIEDIKTGDLVGQISHLRIVPEHGVIEIGHIIFGPSLQRTIGATEAFYLLARKAFDEGYRRLEWKCDNANEASKRAALRYGHTFEGVFRQHMVIKGRNRDSAWFSIVDREWPRRREATERWMDESNFDENGRQKKDLAAFQREVDEEAKDPAAT